MWLIEEGISWKSKFFQHNFFSIILIYNLFSRLDLQSQRNIY
jgi:hypothetical protein